MTPRARRAGPSPAATPQHQHSARPPQAPTRAWGHRSSVNPAVRGAIRSTLQRGEGSPKVTRCVTQHPGPRTGACAASRPGCWEPLAVGREAHAQECVVRARG